MAYNVCNQVFERFRNFLICVTAPRAGWKSRLLAVGIVGLVLAFAQLSSAETKEEHPLESLKKQAKKGDNNARYKLGRAYMAGQLGLEENVKQAVYWFKQAADDNHGAAQFDLALCYEQGIGVKEDKERSIEMYIKAAEQRIKNAYTKSGLILKALDRPEAAAESFRLGAERLNPVSLREYGRALMYGLGVAMDVPGSVFYLERAAHAGDAESNLLLAEIHTGNHKDISPNPKKMIHYLWEAANGNLASAQSKLGYCYEEGIGVMKDTGVAVRWYTKAANQGYARAMINLANCYDLGRGMPMSKSEAFKWYKKAADQDFPLGLYNVGVSYAAGNGVEPDDVQALKYLTKAAEIGEVNAQFNLGVIYEKGIGTAPNSENAFYWYRMCAEQNDPRGLRALAVCYIKGLGTIVDEAKANLYFHKAANLNKEKTIPILETSY